MMSGNSGLWEKNSPFPGLWSTSEGPWAGVLAGTGVPVLRQDLDLKSLCDPEQVT